MIPVLAVWVDILTFASIALLAIPAFHINRYARRAARLSALRFEPGFGVLSEVFVKAKRELEETRDGWKPWKAWLLMLGTIAGALAALLSLADHVHSYMGSAGVAG